jgi:phage shock protein C
MYCPHCGKEISSEANFCSACGRGPVTHANPYASTRIVRPRTPRAVAGVCAGFALHYGWDLNLTRILFAVGTLLTFPLGVILYVIAWVVMPDAQFALPQTTP